MFSAGGPGYLFFIFLFFLFFWCDLMKKCLGTTEITPSHVVTSVMCVAFVAQWLVFTLD